MWVPAGLDTVMFMRIMLFGIQLFLPMSVIGMGLRALPAGTVLVYLRSRDGSRKLRHGTAVTVVCRSWVKRAATAASHRFGECSS